VNVVAVTNDRGEVVNADLLAAAEGVHRQLRPQLPPGYVERMKEIFAGGAEMAVAETAGRVSGITVQAHKFYFREGMTITSFHFSKKSA
jgi:flavin-dependent dehydrogenase